MSLLHSPCQIVEFRLKKHLNRSSHERENGKKSLEWQDTRITWIDGEILGLLTHKIFVTLLYPGGGLLRTNLIANWVN